MYLLIQLRPRTSSSITNHLYILNIQPGLILTEMEKQIHLDPNMLSVLMQFTMQPREITNTKQESFVIYIDRRLSMQMGGKYGPR